VLVHESAILVGFPLACCAWFHASRRRAAAGEPALSAAPLLLPVAAFAAITLVPLPPGFESSFAHRLAQFDFIKKVKKLFPLLLLDDIFDKLDEFRMSRLMELVSHDNFGQIFITDTHPERVENIFRSINKPVRIFSIENGTVK
jgi:hypothetical protein